jgi:hypothetical protein
MHTLVPAPRRLTEGEWAHTEERTERVLGLIDELGLRKCIDTKVGG